MHIGKQSGTYCPFKEIVHFLLLFSQTEALFFPFSEAAFFSAQRFDLFWRLEQSCST